MDYCGSCHCGAVRFRIDCEAISEALRCNCSICARKNAPMSTVYFQPSQIQIEGLENCAVYHWNDGDVNHYFCKACGIYPFHDTLQKPQYYRVNLACIDGLDCSALKMRHFDGRHLL